ncbi:MAG: hypothetical protein KDA42_13515 [Planctomycetales bacterium]|nr:hypothetical protein [Planctomycetales bacterium]
MTSSTLPGAQTPHVRTEEQNRFPQRGSGEFDHDYRCHWLTWLWELITGAYGISR